MRSAALLAVLAAWAWAAAPQGRVEVSATVADAEGKPVADAVVFVHELKGQSFPPPAHPAVMDQVDKEFVPHLLPVLAGTKVRFPNKDDIHHHIYSFSEAKTLDLPLYQGEPAEPVLFDKPGVVKLGCNIHDWMNGVVLVLPNPYFARTDAEGKAALSVPALPGLELAVFHERLKGPVDATRRALAAKGGRAAAAWRLDLKRARPSRRPAVEYR